MGGMAERGGLGGRECDEVEGREEVEAASPQTKGREEDR